MLGLVFDCLLKLVMLVTRSEVLTWIDEIEAEACKWDGVSPAIHKYGGIQFNYSGKEIGHIHSNGLLDMPLSRKVKAELMHEGRIQDHHSFKNTGWISFYIKTQNGRMYAARLLRHGYLLKVGRAHSNAEQLPQFFDT